MGGGGGGTLGQIASAVVNPISAAAGAAGSAIGGPVGGQIAGFGANPVGAMLGNSIGNALTPPDQPNAPGTNPALARLQQQQLSYANQFSQNLPQMQRQMQQQLTNQANQKTNAEIKQVKNQNNARGLTYSGINQGQQQQVRAVEQQNLAGSVSGANANLQNAANTLNAQAVETGVGIQQTQQAIQNQIYQQQMAQMNAQNSMFGSALGTGILAAAVL